MFHPDPTSVTLEELLTSMPGPSVASHPVIGEAISSTVHKTSGQVVLSVKQPIKFFRKDDKTTLEQAGVIFEPSDSESQLCKVIMPLGWVEKPKCHSGWFDLLDTEGRSRALIWYTNAYFDRVAYMHGFLLSGAANLSNMEECETYLNNKYPRWEQLGAYDNETPEESARLDSLFLSSAFDSVGAK